MIKICRFGENVEFSTTHTTTIFHFSSKKKADAVYSLVSKKILRILTKESKQ